MDPEERLTEVFDRGLRDGLHSLTPEERKLFCIQEFIIEFEMNGLHGFFYNRLPYPAGIFAAIEAMEQFAIVELAAVLREAASLFQDYTELDTHTTWGEVLGRYDPDDRLSELDYRIGTIRGYGLDTSLIT